MISYDSAARDGETNSQRVAREGRNAPTMPGTARKRQMQPLRWPPAALQPTSMVVAALLAISPKSSIKSM